MILSTDIPVYISKAKRKLYITLKYTLLKCVLAKEDTKRIESYSTQKGMHADLTKNTHIS